MQVGGCSAAAPPARRRRYHAHPAPLPFFLCSSDVSPMHEACKRVTGKACLAMPARHAQQPSCENLARTCRFAVGPLRTHPPTRRCAPGRWHLVAVPVVASVPVKQISLGREMEQRLLPRGCAPPAGGANLFTRNSDRTDTERNHLGSALQGLSNGPIGGLSRSLHDLQNGVERLGDMHRPVGAPRRAASSAGSAGAKKACHRQSILPHTKPSPHVAIHAGGEHGEDGWQVPTHEGCKISAAGSGARTADCPGNAVRYQRELCTACSSTRCVEMLG